MLNWTVLELAAAAVWRQTSTPKMSQTLTLLASLAKPVVLEEELFPTFIETRHRIQCRAEKEKRKEGGEELRGERKRRRARARELCKFSGPNLFVLAHNFLVVCLLSTSKTSACSSHTILRSLRSNGSQIVDAKALKL